jgi:predicted Ser/Thr protein kinase
MVGPYRLVQQLGEGGMGVVHLALDHHGRAVALKLLRPHIAHDPAARHRLSREVDILRRIEHPRVAPVVDADLEGERPYVVTRYVPGPSLDEVVRESGPMQGAELHRLARGLAEALNAIHAADVIHRDLKPGNVLLQDGEPVLIDFGIAHVADDIRITMTGLVMGTPGYLSPEVVEGAPVTEATDWWGWASTLAFAASGAPPFGRGPMDAVLSRVARGEADLGRVDPRLAPLLYAALSPAPAQRPDADEVIDALERYAAGQPVTDALHPGWDAARPEAGTRHTQVLSSAGTRPVDPPPEDYADPPLDPLGPLGLPVEAEPWPVQGGDQGYGGLQAWDEPSDDLSDWEAAAQTGPGQPDPRIGRPNRSGTLAALLAALVATAAMWPVLAIAIGVVWCWLARTADRSVTSLVKRRYSKGMRRSDVPVAVLASPWHVVVAALATLLALLLPAVVGVSSVFCTALALVAIQGGSPEPGRSIPLAVGALLGGLTAWWGPGGASLRRGSRSVVRGVTRGATARAAVTALLLLAAAGIAAWAVTNDAQPVWFPMSGPPTLWGTGANPFR